MTQRDVDTVALLEKRISELERSDFCAPSKSMRASARLQRSAVIHELKKHIYEIQQRAEA